MTPNLQISEQLVRENVKMDDNISRLLRVHGERRISFPHNEEKTCFELHITDSACLVSTNYFIGLDWLVPGKLALHIEPKLNKGVQIDFLDMLLEGLEAPENLKHLDNLYHVDYDKQWIEANEQVKDMLSPLLVVQFLMLTQRIVRKGLKKSYYRVTEHLEGRVKGKILVGRQIKENVSKKRLTRTVCSYQDYGLNTKENQFLKLVMKFASSYLAQRHHFFTAKQNQDLQHILNCCLPAFEKVDMPEVKYGDIHIARNPFYREYEKAIEVGRYILRRFSFNINKISEAEMSCPPFWIDMSKLFELYVFGKLRRVFPQAGDVTYHDSFRGGKQTDILIRTENYKCVIDCKYKPRYKDASPSLEDKRQLAGYTRLKSVYKRLDIDEKDVVRGVIIFSNQECPENIDRHALFESEIAEYVEFYKLGIKLPEL